jgi:N-acetylglutamate synthase-like GNAT family acetyltransferase
MTTTEPHEHDHEHQHGSSDGPIADASVRTARTSDAPAVGRVQAAVWEDAYAGILSPELLVQFEEQSFAKAWRATLEEPPSSRHRLLVACAGPQVVGFVALGPSGDPDAGADHGELLTLGVHPQARRVGHGSRLLNAAVDTMRVVGFEQCVAWLLATDETTRAFLEVAGLAPDGAFRDRVIDPDGSVVREVRLAVDLSTP